MRLNAYEYSRILHWVGSRFQHNLNPSRVHTGNAHVTHFCSTNTLAVVYMVNESLRFHAKMQLQLNFSIMW